VAFFAPLVYLMNPSLRGARKRDKMPLEKYHGESLSDFGKRLEGSLGKTRVMRRGLV
jgi:hypothetical protein